MEKFLKDSDVLSRRTLLSSGALVGLGALLRRVASRQITRRQQPRLQRRAKPLRLLPQHLMRLPLLRARSLPADTPAAPRRPDGEYREADEYGMAQNVPLPKAKPQQYPEPSLVSVR